MITLVTIPVAVRQDVESTVFYHEFGEIMMRAPVIGLEFTRYLPLALVPFVLLQVHSRCALNGESGLFF